MNEVQPGSGRRALPAILAFIGIGFGAVAALATTMIIGRSAGAFAIGGYFQFVAIFSVAATICTFGADTGLVRFLAARRALGQGAEFRPLIRHAIVPVFCATSLVVLIGIATTVFLQEMDRTPSVPEYALASAPFLVLATLMSTMFGALRGLGRVVHFTLLQSVILPLLRLVGILTVIYLGFSVDGLVAAWLAPIVVTVLITFILLRRALQDGDSFTSGVGTSNGRSFSLRDGRSFWRFSSARGVSSGLEILLEWIDVLAVALMLGQSAAGVYAVVTRCIRVGQIVDHAVRTVSSPNISASLATGQIEQVKEIFIVSGKVLILLAWPIYLTLLIKAPEVLLVFGSEFDEGATALRVLAVAMLIAVTAGGVQSMLLMGGRSHWQAMNKGVALVIAAILLLLLVPVLGIAGAAMAWATAVLVDCALASYQVAKKMGIRLPLRQLALPVFIVTAFFAAPLCIGNVFSNQEPLSFFAQMLVAALLTSGAVFVLRDKLGLTISLASRGDERVAVGG
ncbi:lipopolysaccharide biosynthesis protein [Arthrobacter sp. MDB2-24]